MLEKYARVLEAIQQLGVKDDRQRWTSRRDDTAQSLASGLASSFLLTLSAWNLDKVGTKNSGRYEEKDKESRAE